MAYQERISIMHPAANIFREYVLSDVGEENRRLADDAARLQQLLAYIDKVTLVATTNDMSTFLLCLVWVLSMDPMSPCMSRT